MPQIAEIRMIDDAVWARIPVSGDDGRVQLLTDAEMTANDQKMARLLDENARLQEAQRRALAIADERGKESNALRSALTQIAMFDDKGANEHLEKTGSYGRFDEPGSVKLAREALRHLEQTLRPEEG